MGARSREPGSCLVRSTTRWPLRPIARDLLRPRSQVVLRLELVFPKASRRTAEQSTLASTMMLANFSVAPAGCLRSRHCFEISLWPGPCLSAIGGTRPGAAVQISTKRSAGSGHYLPARSLSRPARCRPICSIAILASIKTTAATSNMPTFSPAAQPISSATVGVI
jgi:hypothetical protein